MKKHKAILSLIVSVIGFLAVVVAIEVPRKPESKDKAYILPRVEDMPTVANPLQF